MRTHVLHSKVQTALDQIDEAVLETLIQSDQPLRPR